MAEGPGPWLASAQEVDLKTIHRCRLSRSDDSLVARRPLPGGVSPLRSRPTVAATCRSGFQQKMRRAARAGILDGHRNVIYSIVHITRVDTRATSAACRGLG